MDGITNYSERFHPQTRHGPGFGLILAASSMDRSKIPPAELDSMLSNPLYEDQPDAPCRHSLSV